MSAHYGPTDFMINNQAAAPILVRPNVSERYWGYDVATGGLEFDLAVLARGFAFLAMIGAFAASVCIWFMPSGLFIAGAKSIASPTLFGLGLLLFRFAGRSTRVRVQIDTGQGEIREVVAGAFGDDIVLARYGLDSVCDVTLAHSISDPDMGQIQIALSDGRILPVGDGSLLALGPLMARVAKDCGIERAG